MHYFNIQLITKLLILYKSKGNSIHKRLIILAYFEKQQLLLPPVIPKPPQSNHNITTPFPFRNPTVCHFDRREKSHKAANIKKSHKVTTTFPFRYPTVCHFDRREKSHKVANTK